MDELDIFQGCLSKKNSSRKDLYALYYGKMMGVCLRYANSNANAKEVLHQSFLNLYEKIHNIKADEFGEKWIKETIINTALEQIHKNKENLLIVSTVHANKRNDNLIDKVVDDTVHLNFTKEEILKAVQGLTPRYRSIYNLFVIDGYSHKEIAELLDISEETSMLNLNKAKFALRKNLVPYLTPVNG